MSSVPTPPPIARPPSKKKGSNLKWYVIGVVVIGGLAGFAVVKSKNSNSDAIAITTDKAVVKTITQIVTATGKIQPQKEVRIAPEVSGEIIALPFKEGDSVKQGDLLVKLKPDNFQFAVDQQEASLASARASLVDAESRFSQAAEDFKRTEAVFQTQFLSDQDMTAARTRLEGAKASLVSAQANVKRSEGSVSQAKDQLGKTTILSPIAGKVSVLNNQVGERVTGSGGYGSVDLMRVADLENMEIRVKVNENDIVNVKVGNKAVINIDAFPGKKFNGVVSEISNSAQSASGGQGTDDVSNFQVKIHITDRGVQIRPGMSATADIETQTVESVVAVPIQSVTIRSGQGETSEEIQKQKAKEAAEKKGKNDIDIATEKKDVRSNRAQLQQVVFVRSGDTVKLQKVESGIADNTSIEIKTGLKADDEVVSGSYAAISRLLKDGSKIRIEQPKAAAKK